MIRATRDPLGLRFGIGWLSLERTNGGPNRWLQATAASQPLGQTVLGRNFGVGCAAPEPRRSP